MKNIPKNYSPADYAALDFIFHSRPPEPGFVPGRVPGPIAVVGVHLHDGDDEFMKTLVAGTEAVCAAVGKEFSKLVLIRNGTPPASLAGRPEAELFGDFDLNNDRFADLVLAQRRIVMVGWDARACVIQTLDAVAAMLPDAESELHFPFGPFHDEKLDVADEHDDPKVLVTSLLGSYARRVAQVRGIVDVTFGGVYVGRHGEGEPRTNLHFHPSPEAFAASLQS